MFYPHRPGTSGAWYDYFNRLLSVEARRGWRSARTEENVPENLEDSHAAAWSCRACVCTNARPPARSDDANAHP